ncbi:MAG: type I methionyl aminopeptidase [Bacteroidales bacterium]|nr:type I methionyl aminopeptidase [Bacteroidales bacterium]MBQ1636834.1 type I methionyl aminopeptidase [Bacteroidales bacterium]MBQ1754149.1 type I methionyl aminopeptidase [Bacteroidales bacterium]MBQ1831022.1 type I methionyl aminopeptidase [Bacteroidales bacterium]MBQ2149263.1 type I methionyl aminopeptidase [Bacteroidales bacterium]
MIRLKSEEEIALLRENALMVSKTLAEVGRHIEPGITTKELDVIAEKYIRSLGAEPGFLGYEGFPGTLCMSVNDVVVHGFPSGYKLKEGDIVSVDCGTIYRGYYGDSAYTFPVGKVSPRVQQLLDATKHSLELGIEQAVAGNRTGDIGEAVQSYCESLGFSIVRELVGHGVGRDMHESPEVPNYGRRGHGVKLHEGMVICIEPMVNAGRKEVYLDDNGWAVHTADGAPSAHFEKTVAVRHGKAEVLTTYEFIENNNR